MNRRSLVDLALAAYPKWWKARYGEEVSSLCDDLMAVKVVPEWQTPLRTEDARISDVEALLLAVDGRFRAPGAT